MLPSTLQFFIVLIACAINERQQKALDYKAEEVVILKEILTAITKKTRIDFTEDQRARLALVGKAVVRQNPSAARSFGFPYFAKPRGDRGE